MAVPIEPSCQRFHVRLSQNAILKQASGPMMYFQCFRIDYWH